MVVDSAMTLLRAAYFFLAALAAASPSHAFLLHHRGGGGSNPPPPQVAEEEFVGPFASWACVRTLASGTCGAAAAAFGTATGNGSTDDTAAIQTAINGLSSSVPVLWVPAGTYKVSDVSTTGSASGSSTALTVGSGTGIVQGMEVTCANVPIGDTVASITGTAVTLALATTGAVSGTCKFNLAVQGALYIGVIGADPTTTSFVWAGSSGGTMLRIGGTAYSRFDRITFNAQGANAAGIIVDLDWTNDAGNYFPTSNEFTDDTLENASTGIRCGITAGCSEVSIVRDTFLNNTMTGIIPMNFNAGDIWVWYSTFTGNGYGITNNTQGLVGGVNGASNFQVFDSIFTNQVYSDAGCANVEFFTVRNSYSSGSHYFWHCGGSDGPNPITLQGNTILSPTAAQPIYQHDGGPLFLIDNTICTSGAASTPPVSTTFGDMFSVGNTFTVSPQGSAETANTSALGFHYHSVSDTFGATCPNPPPPTLPPTPPNNGRAIYDTDASTGAGTTCSAASPCTVVTAITKAEAVCGNAVVHLRPQNYTIQSSLILNANCPIQIIGDGGNSRLNAGGSLGNNPVLDLLGPSKVTLTDFQVFGSSNVGDGIDVTNADQPGSRVYIQQPVLGGSTINLRANALDYTRVEVHNVYPSSATDTGIKVVGGSSAAGGNWLGGSTNVFAAISADNALAYGVSAGGHELVQGNWNDTGSTGGTNAVATMTGNSSFTYAGSLLARFYGVSTNATIAGTVLTLPSVNPGSVFRAGQVVLGTGVTAGTTIVSQASGTTGQAGTYNLSASSTVSSPETIGAYDPVVSINNFTGEAALLNLLPSGTIGITGNGSGGQVLAAGVSGLTTNFFTDTSSPSDTSYFLNGQGGPAGTSAVPLAEVPTSGWNNAVILAALAQMRATAPVQRTPTANGVTDVGMYRVFVSNALIGIDLEH